MKFWSLLKNEESFRFCWIPFHYLEIVRGRPKEFHMFELGIFFGISSKKPQWVVMMNKVSLHFLNKKEKSRLATKYVMYYKHDWAMFSVSHYYWTHFYLLTHNCNPVCTQKIAVLTKKSELINMKILRATIESYKRPMSKILFYSLTFFIQKSIIYLELVFHS